MPTQSGDAYRCFSVVTSFAEDRYFTAAEVLPGNAQIVHHIWRWWTRRGVRRT